MKEDNSNYYQKVPIPVKMIKSEKGNPEKTKRKIILGLSKQFLKKAGYSVLILSLISAQVYLLSAFEAHIVNVTAHICKPSETRTMGYWKTHCENYEPYCVPDFVGDIPVGDCTAAELIFDAANADEMSDMLMGQLLAMKFNIGCSGIDPCDGEQFWLEGQGSFTLDTIVAMADDLLRNPDSTREELEAMKNLLDGLNNRDYIKYCSTPPYWFIDGFGSLSLETEQDTTTDNSNQELLTLSEETNPDNPEETINGGGEGAIIDNPGEETVTPPQDGINLLGDELIEESSGEETAPQTEEPLAEEPSAEEPPAEEPLVEEPPAEEPPAEEVPTEEPPAEESPTTETTETPSETPETPPETNQTTNNETTTE